MPSRKKIGEPHAPGLSTSKCNYILIVTYQPSEVTSAEILVRIENYVRMWPHLINFHVDRGSVPLSRIYTDFLRYLLQRTQEFLLERTGRDVWSDFPGRAEIVLSHPNRWGADQQKFLESVAIQAGLVTKDGARRYLHFVEEAEAAACFSLTDRTLYSSMQVC